MKPDQPGYSSQKECGCVFTLIEHDTDLERSIILMDWSRCRFKHQETPV